MLIFCGCFGSKCIFKHWIECKSRSTCVWGIYPKCIWDKCTSSPSTYTVVHSSRAWVSLTFYTTHNSTQCANYNWIVNTLNTFSAFTVSFKSIEIPEKVFGGFDNIFYVFLMKGFQKYGRNWILMVAFWGQTKAGQKCAARWAELAVLFCR